MTASLTLLFSLGLALQETDPRESPVFQEAARRYAQGENEVAVRQFTDFCRAKPRSPVKWFRVAEFLAERRDFESCDFFAAKAYKLLPEIPKAHTIMGLVLLHSQRVAEAEVLFDQATQQFPEQTLMRYNLGLACGLNKKTLDAQSHFEAILEIDPDNPSFNYSAGENCALLGRLEDAASYFRKANQGEYAHSNALWKLGQTLVHLEREKEAEECFREAVESGPSAGRVSAALQYGIFLFERERLAEALVQLNSVVNELPDKRMAWLYHARCLNALGQRDQSKASLTRYQELQAKEDREADRQVLERIASQLQHDSDGEGKKSGSKEVPDGA